MGKSWENRFVGTPSGVPKGTGPAAVANDLGKGQNDGMAGQEKRGRQWLKSSEPLANTGVKNLDGGSRGVYYKR